MVRVLVVDDSSMMRLRLTQILKELGMMVVAEAKDGQDAIEQFRTVKPDLVILDISMPVMDGIAALQEMRKINPQAKIVMVTAVQQKETVRQALQLGAANYIVKPFKQEEVARRLRALFVDCPPAAAAEAPEPDQGAPPPGNDD